MTEYGFISIKYDDPNVPEETNDKMGKKLIIELIVVASIIGLSILGFEYGCDVFAKLIVKTPLYAYYDTSEAMFNIIQALFSLFAILIPFGIAFGLIKLIQKDSPALPFDAPKSKRLFASSLAIAFLAVVISNFFVSVFALAGEAVGFSIESADTVAPQSFTGYLWQIFSIALVPAFVEEFAIRGVIMTSLRKYGDLFAVIVSSFFFGLMHGNVLQAPFAMVLGFVIGWTVIKTNSLWTGIAIHFLNNFYAISVTALNEIASMSVYVAVIATINVIGALLGVFCIVWLIDNSRDEFKMGNKYRGKNYLFIFAALPLIAAFVLLFSDCISTVHYVGL